jgi:hypothetical protein
VVLPRGADGAPRGAAPPLGAARRSAVGAAEAAHKLTKQGQLAGMTAEGGRGMVRRFHRSAIDAVHDSRTYYPAELPEYCRSSVSLRGWGGPPRFVAVPRRAAPRHRPARRAG